VFTPGNHNSQTLDAGAPPMGMHRSVSASSLVEGRATPPVAFFSPFVPQGGGESGGYKPPTFMLPQPQFPSEPQPNTSGDAVQQ
jgi:hypothetical protein